MASLALIDAYNVMYRRWRSVPEDRDASRERLVRETAAALGGVRGVGRAHLVFDTWAGAARAGLRSRDGRVSWHYAHGSADEAILEHLRRHEGRKAGVSLLVVTDDRELAGRARQLGARTMGVAAFYASSGSQPPRVGRRTPLDGPPLSAQDFGLPEGPITLTDDDDRF